jgi:hypothetical protein
VTRRGSKSRRRRPRRAPLSRAELLTLAKLEAMRAGLDLRELEPGGDVVLSDGGMESRLSLRDACGVLAITRGTACNEHVRRFGDVG